MSTTKVKKRVTAILEIWVHEGETPLEALRREVAFGYVSVEGVVETPREDNKTTDSDITAR